jgi:hypothetical protein
MWFRNLFDCLKPNRSRAPSCPLQCNTLGRQLARPAFETLEDRCVPATLSISDLTLVEGNTGSQNALVTVSLSAPINQTLKVNYSTANGTATAGSDYQAVSGRLSFPRGTTSRTISVPVIGDTVRESNETVHVNLSNANHATIADGQGVVTIVDNDTSIRIDDVSTAEGNAGTTAFTFTVSLSGAALAVTTVNYATANGSASAGSDYQATSGTLTFAVGQISKPVTVQVNGDPLFEGNEIFNVNLSNPTNAVIADGQGVGTIVDDEPRISIEGTAVVEGNDGTTELTFTVTLSTTSVETVTVDYTTLDYTAIAGSDYQGAAGTLTFTPGQTSQPITIVVNGDLDEEFDEYMYVELSNPTNAYLEVNQGWGTILSDEVPLYVWIDSVSGWEGDSGSTYFGFTVWLSEESDEIVTVDFNSYDGWATAWWDYLPVAGTLTFNPGETSHTIWVEVIGDVEYEGDEDFYVILSNISSTALIYGDVGYGTIWDEEYYWW